MGQIGEGEVGVSTVGVKGQFGRPWGLSLCLSSSPRQGSQVPQHTTGLSLWLGFCLFQSVLVYVSHTLRKALRPHSFNLGSLWELTAPFPESQFQGDKQACLQQASPEHSWTHK